MSWLLYLFGSGQALFLGAAMILAAAALLPRVSGWKAAALAMLVRVGLVLAIVSAVPLSYWLYASAIGLTAVWLWRERREKLKPSASCANGTTAAEPLALRRATVVLWIGIVLLELPYHFLPRLPGAGNPPLFIIGDSLSAGIGSGTRHTWPELLPDSVEVHNLARPGATTAMAWKSQANQLPPAGGLVLIEIGGNDLLGTTTAREFERHLEALLARASGSAEGSPSQVAKASPRTVVMFELPLPPMSNEYGRIQRRLAGRYGVHLIPKRVFMGVLAGGGATLDSIHLTDEGHEHMAATVWQVIGTVYAPSHPGNGK